MNANAVLGFFSKKASLFFCIFLWIACVLFALPAHAAQDDRFSGWAWSENIGWISFNCTNTNSCGTVDYGVTVFGNGAVQSLSGWAWAPNVGWIDFSQGSMVAANRSLTGKAVVYSTIQEPYCNSSDPYQTNPSGTVGVAAGSFSCTDISEDDGWNGVIDLSLTSPIPFGPVADATDDTADGWDWPDDQFYLMDGYAWSGLVLGWTSFSCQTTSSCGTVGYGVFIDPFFFSFSADKGLTTTDKVDYEGSFNHIWTLSPDNEISTCIASGGPGDWSTNPNKATNPSPLSDLVVNAVLTATSTLTCTNVDNKSLTREVLIYVKNPPPTLSFTALDYNIGYTSQADLVWSTTNVQSCTASAGDAGWTGPQSLPGGTYQSSGLTNDTTFNMTCVSPYPDDYPNPLLGTLEVTIQRLIVDFYAEDDEGNPINSNELNAYTEKDNINLVWETEFATGGCTASGDWTGTKVAANSSNDVVDGTELATIPDGGTFTYTLTCDGELGQQITRTISIRITRNPEFTEDISTN